MKQPKVMIAHMTPRSIQQLLQNGTSVVTTQQTTPHDEAFALVPVGMLSPAVIGETNDTAEINELAAFVSVFATAMLEKLIKARAKRGFTNDFIKDVDNADTMRLALYNHINKGDPVDVGNYAMFLHMLGEPTANDRMNTTSIIEQRILKAVQNEILFYAEHPPRFMSNPNQTPPAGIPQRFAEQQQDVTGEQLELDLGSVENTGTQNK